MLEIRNFSSGFKLQFNFGPPALGSGSATLQWLHVNTFIFAAKSFLKCCVQRKHSLSYSAVVPVPYMLHRLRYHTTQGTQYWNALF